MGLFTKKITPITAPLYTVGNQQTVLVVGLGNPGKKYESTRHNIGFACVDEFAVLNDFPKWINKKDLRCELAQKSLGDSRVILVKPTTFMNLSGEAVNNVLQFYKIPSEKTVVVHDELDLKFGLIRTQTGGSDAGHNGIKSLIEQCGKDFGRLRIGVGPKKSEADLPAGRQVDSADFVLAAFSPNEQVHLPALKREVTAILTEYVYGGSLLAETRQVVDF